MQQNIPPQHCFVSWVNIFFLYALDNFLFFPLTYVDILIPSRACTSLPGQLMICTELMSSNLEALLLNPHTKLALLPRMKMARDAALGILWLHSSNPVFIHRDLKVSHHKEYHFLNDGVNLFIFALQTSNLLVDSNMTVKVCDFGLSQIKLRGVNLKDGQEGAKGVHIRFLFLFAILLLSILFILFIRHRYGWPRKCFWDNLLTKKQTFTGTISLP